MRHNFGRMISTHVWFRNFTLHRFPKAIHTLIDWPFFSVSFTKNGLIHASLILVASIIYIINQSAYLECNRGRRKLLFFCLHHRFVSFAVNMFLIINLLSQSNGFIVVICRFFLHQKWIRAITHIITLAIAVIMVFKNNLIEIGLISWTKFACCPSQCREIVEEKQETENIRKMACKTPIHTRFYNSKCW